MWLFGYGSLIWKVDFPFKKKVVGYIKGYNRRFYQASTDHRGIPGKPGRVVTLLPSADSEEVVWGVAYEISIEDSSKVLGHLDHREKSGYDKKNVKFYPKEKPHEPFKVFLYIGDRSNDWYLGEAQIEVIARQIADSVGPSGSNAEYLFQLASAMRDLAPDYNDQHLFELEAAVRKLVSKSSHPVSHG